MYVEIHDIGVFSYQVIDYYYQVHCQTGCNQRCDLEVNLKQVIYILCADLERFKFHVEIECAQAV